MITNSSLTIYHKGFNSSTKLEKWTRYNYDKVWFFDTQGAKTDKGYSENYSSYREALEAGLKEILNEKSIQNL